MSYQVHDRCLVAEALFVAQIWNRNDCQHWSTTNSAHKILDFLLSSAGYEHILHILHRKFSSMIIPDCIWYKPDSIRNFFFGAAMYQHWVDVEAKSGYWVNFTAKRELQTGQGEHNVRQEKLDKGLRYISQWNVLSRERSSHMYHL